MKYEGLEMIYKKKKKRRYEITRIIYVQIGLFETFKGIYKYFFCLLFEFTLRHCIL
jgi:hypothetical protein